MSKKPFNKLLLFRNNDLKIPFAIAAIHQNIIKTIIQVSHVCFYQVLFISLLLYCSPLYFAPLVMPKGTAIESHRLSS